MLDGTQLAAALSDGADHHGALAWPLAVVVIVVVLRVPLRALVEHIGSSARSVSIGPGGVSVDFEAAVTTVAPQSATVAPHAGARLRRDAR